MFRASSEDVSSPSPPALPESSKPEPPHPLSSNVPAIASAPAPAIARVFLVMSVSFDKHRARPPGGRGPRNRLGYVHSLNDQIRSLQASYDSSRGDVNPLRATVSITI